MGSALFIGFTIYVKEGGAMSSDGLIDEHRAPEAAFVDACRTLLRYKRVILFIWVLVSLVGVVAAVLMPSRYAYMTLIEVGGSKGGLVETTGAARARLKASILPDIERKYVDMGKYFHDLDVVVKSPSTLQLKSVGPSNSIEDHRTLHAASVEALRQAHETMVSRMSAKLALRQSEIGAELKELEGHVEALTLRLKAIDLVQTNLNRAPQESDPTPLVNYSYLQDLYEIQRIETQVAISSAFKKIKAKRAELSENRQEVLVETKASGSLERSINPVGPSRALIVALAILGGLLVGVLSVFLMESFLELRRSVLEIRARILS
jgi:uncharacterized protein involved in exopolysaccharide biosynthesis